MVIAAIRLLKALKHGDIVKVLEGHYAGKTGTIDEVCTRKYDGKEWVTVLFPGHRVPRMVVKQDVKLVSQITN